MVIECVISGGQIGADIAGVRAAKKLGIPTGGTMPKGFRTRLGYRPYLASLYGFTEHSSPSYPPRTRLNVTDSDATIRFAHTWDSPGELATLREITRESRPYKDVTIHRRLDHFDLLPNPMVVAKWVTDHGFVVLNIAGNADEQIEDPVEEYLSAMLASILNT